MSELANTALSEVTYPEKKRVFSLTCSLLSNILFLSLSLRGARRLERHNKGESGLEYTADDGRKVECWVWKG